MAYLERIASEQNLSMDRMLAISRSLLPYQYRRCPWNYAGNHGVALLSTEEQMDAYVSAYGEMHMVKCRAALQNLPFESLPFNIEIVDWGCGQGIASLTLLDVLREHNIIDRVRKVTLIEPSSAALARAEANVRNALYGRNTEVTAVQKFLPADYASPETVSGISFTAAATINLFSNVLDIPTISLRDTARLLLSSGRTHYVICTGPLNENSGRIDEFCQLLNARNYFSCITSPKYAYTSDTHHIFGCKTRAFVIENVSSASVNETVQLGHYEMSGAYDDYDRRALVRNGLLSEGFFNTYEAFASRLSQYDSIFIKPSLESDNPDLVIIRPRYGILIVKIFEDNTDDLTLTSDGIYHTSDDEHEICLASPISTVLGYKQNLETQYSNLIQDRKVAAKSAYYIVKTAVCFPGLTDTGAKAFCKSHYDSLPGSTKSCVSILGNDSFDDNLWKNVGFDRSSFQVDNDVCNDIKNILSSKWHSYKEGNAEIRLTREQRENAESRADGRKKIKGVAGSGKTQVLVSRAVNCLMRTGGKVLVLTYNITLANYIKDRLSQVPADFLWDNFTFGTYYRFITSQAKNSGLKLSIASSYEQEDFFEGARNLPKYDAILVDEVQDYKTEWLTILQKYFLRKGGEFVVFGDVKQNIYGRPIGDATEQMVVVPGVPGRWSILHKCHRASNRQLVNLALGFQRTFMPELTADDVTDEGQAEFDYSHVNYCDLGPDASDQRIYEHCREVISDFEADINKTVILSATCDILRNIDFLFRQQGSSTSTMCESKEIYDKLKSESGGYIAKEDIDSYRENKKHHFTMKSEGLKFSTVHSYKGWEAETVILLLQPSGGGRYSTKGQELNDQVVYTGITRSLKNLSIINLGNTGYGDFFLRNI